MATCGDLRKKAPAVIPLNMRRPAHADGVYQSPSETFPLVGVAPNLLLRGNPFGARRPASARLPRQSASSLRANVNDRPALSIQVSPSSALKVLRSDSPPSLNRCKRTPRPRV